MSRLTTKVSFLLLCLPSLWTCSPEDIAGTEHGNAAPKVWLAVAPPEYSTVDYRVHLFWNGHDPDGEVSHYEFVIADTEHGLLLPADTASAWTATDRLDSVFVFSTDVMEDSSDADSGEMTPYEFVRAHTFFVRAVDNDGARSKPAYRTFSTRNLSPVVNITTPRSNGYFPVQVPPIITFHWTAQDFVGDRDETQDPHSVRSIFLEMQRFGGNIQDALEFIRDNPDADEWTDWINYDAPGDSGRFWRPPEAVPFAGFIFAVQVRDEVGAVSPVFDIDRNVRIVRIQDRITGPALILRNKFLGEVKTSTTNTPAVTLNIAGGVPLIFEWTADASSYGGVVHSYRYGWDIDDLGDPDAWDVKETPFVGSHAASQQRTFFFGTHTFHVEVADNSGAKSRALIVVNIVPFTMEKPVLVVDDWGESAQILSFATSNGAEPSDQEHDAFWADVLRNVEGFAPSADIIPIGTAGLDDVPIVTIAQYQAIIWNTRGRAITNSPQAILEPLIQHGSDDLNTLRVFLEAGGKLLICGEHAMSMVLNKTAFGPGQFGGAGPRYPVIYRYEIEGDQSAPYEGQVVGEFGVGQASFAYDDCCLNVIDLTSGINFSKQRRYCVVRDFRDHNAKTEGLRSCLPIDADYDFPLLELRPEVASPGRWFDENRIGLESGIFNPAYFGEICPEAELFPPRDCFQPIYGLGCLDTSSGAYGAPVAFWTSRYAGVRDPRGVAARSAVFGFSPVYIKPEQFRQALEIILFDEWQITQTKDEGNDR